MKSLSIVFFLFAFALCASVNAEAVIPQIGGAPPKLEMLSLDGQKVSLEKSIGKKKIILIFFSSWSKSCQEELNDLESFQKNDKVKLEIIAVSFDKKASELKNYIARSNFSFPIIHDKKLLNIDPFQILIIPTTFCLGIDGKIDRIFIDYDSNIKQALSDWLKS